MRFNATLPIPKRERRTWFRANGGELHDSTHTGGARCVDGTSLELDLTRLVAARQKHRVCAAHRLTHRRIIAETADNEVDAAPENGDGFDRVPHEGAHRRAGVAQVTRDARSNGPGRSGHEDHGSIRSAKL